MFGGGSMKDVVSISLEREQIKAVDLHPLKRDVGRSGVVRIALSEYLEKGKSEKENQNEEEGGEKK